MADPIALLCADREAARAESDPNANLCVLATVDRQGEPQARTLVLRDVESRLALFFNRSSPKHAELAHSKTVALLVHLPSVAVQYRLRCTLQAIPQAVVHASWQLRPPIPKRLDWLYAKWPQGSAVESRERLALLLDAEAPEKAPDSALGFYVVLDVVERLHLNQPNGIHDRRRYERDGGRGDEAWCETVLIP